MWTPPRDNTILVRGYTIGWGKGIPDELTKLVDDKSRFFVIQNLSKLFLLKIVSKLCLIKQKCLKNQGCLPLKKVGCKWSGFHEG